MEQSDIEIKYLNLYKKLICLYPAPYRQRFGEGMAQTFSDLLHDRKKTGEPLFSFILSTFYETIIAIISERISFMTLQYKNILRVFVVAGLILLIPLIAMQFTNEVNWGLFDFIIMGIMIVAVGLVYELIAKRSEKTVYRVAFAVGLVAAFLLGWVNGAVGIIGNEGQDANLIYGAVFIVGLLGSIMARFKPHGMARTLFAAAITQMLVPIAVLIIWPPPDISWSPGVFRVFTLNAFFATLFVVSAMLFRQASQTGSDNKVTA